MNSPNRVTKIVKYVPQRCQRRGVSSIEHVLIAALILVVIALSASVLSQKMNAGMGRLANRMADPSHQSNPAGLGDAVPDETVVAAASDLTLMICFVVLSLVSVSAAAFTLVQNLKRKKEAINPQRGNLPEELQCDGTGVEQTHPIQTAAA